MSEMICIQVLYEHTKTLDMNNVDNHGPQIVLNKDRKHLIQRVYECIFLEVKKNILGCLFAIQVQLEYLVD